MKTLMAFLLLLSLSFDKEKEIKLYIDSPDVKDCEEFTINLLANLRLKDEANSKYRLTYPSEAKDSEYIISIFAEKDIESGKYVAVTIVQKPGSGKNHEAMNVQLHRDLNEIARMASDVIEKAICK